jgi:hypothetical protein
MPVAGVGQHDARRLAHTDGVELAAGCIQHGLQKPEVRGGGHDLGGEDDLVLVGDGLRVVAWRNPRRPLTTRESGSVVLMRPSGVAGGV